MNKYASMQAEIAGAWGQRDRVIAERDRVIAERDKAIARGDKMRADRDEFWNDAREMAVLLSGLRADLAEAVRLLDEAEAYIGDGIVDVATADALIAKIVAFTNSHIEDAR